MGGGFKFSFLVQCLLSSIVCRQLFAFVGVARFATPSTTKQQSGNDKKIDRRTTAGRTIIYRPRETPCNANDGQKTQKTALTQNRVSLSPGPTRAPGFYKPDLRYSLKSTKPVHVKSVNKTSKSFLYLENDGATAGDNPAHKNRPRSGTRGLRHEPVVRCA